MLAYYALDNPQAALREAVKQILFWSSIGCFPASMALFVGTVAFKRRWKYFTCAVFGGVLLTQACWYFKTFALAVSHVRDQTLYPFWLDFAPIGFGVALLCLALRGFIWLCIHAEDLTRRWS